MSKHYHLIVIGAGSGGLVAAAGAAGLGAKVALVEKHKMGGDCLNTGCVPSKAIIRTAKLIYDAKTGSRFGLSDLNADINPSTPLRVDLSQIIKSVQSVQGKLEPHDSPDRFRKLGVDLHFGTFRFISPYEITDGTVTLSAKRFVIATGARPFVPPIKGIQEVPILTSDNVWSLKEIPKRLVVLGGGPIGAELTQVFARLGSRVTVVEMLDSLLIREDAEVSQAIKERFIKEGIEVLTGHKAVEINPSTLLRVDAERSRSIKKSGESFELMAQEGEKEKRIPFDQILVAVGRAPNVNNLDLEKAGIRFSRKGIAVDDYLRTCGRYSPNIGKTYLCLWRCRRPLSIHPHRRLSGAADLTKCTLSRQIKDRLPGRSVVHLHRSGGGAGWLERKRSQGKRSPP
ncbi:MAG: FAD-dependent oxidoreductase [Deltaproteobacteria bacterium]|nr:FAD-dependent oxidoreductase [Deltaproteobacteria bacterium]